MSTAICPASPDAFKNLPAGSTIYLEVCPGKPNYVRGFIMQEGVLSNLNADCLRGLKSNKLFADRFWWVVRGVGFSKATDIAENLTYAWEKAHPGEKAKFQFFTL